MIDLRCDHTYPPSVNRQGDVGFDLYVPELKTLPANQPTLLKSGVFVEHIQAGFWLQILTKSGSPRRGFMTLAGVVDTGYRGELGIWLHSFREVRLEAGDAIAQVIIRQAWYPDEHVRVNGRALMVQDQAARREDGGLWRKEDKT